ncbi:hypothetical protein PT974_09222 [Cladobotryum mycophilum]|uniref:Borealin N-terminal domain-containing protein n=1 Tax=Cladobotryum mycophilum TaxID=491253 RepID=A0ABR0SGK7_9HYPO
MAPITIPKMLDGSLSPSKRAQLMNIASPSTPHRSPIKKRKVGISLQQKQTMIENLRLEITERARRLRAQYHLQAQGLRSRVEIRVNRIPMALRKLKMGDLLVKFIDQEQQQQQLQLQQRDIARQLPPAVPTKEISSRLSPQKPPQQINRNQNVARPQKRLSNAITGDKENDIENVENPKKRIRGADVMTARSTQVLSPTSSNSRLLTNRERPASPTKPQMAKPASPVKAQGAVRSAVATGVLSTMVEKAKAARAGTRKVTASSTASSSSSGAGTTAPTRTKRAATAPKAPVSRPGTRTARRASGNSETSEASTNTVVKKTGAKNTTTAAKKTAGGAKKGAVGSEAKSSDIGKSKSATGRVLRKRG